MTNLRKAMQERRRKLHQARIKGELSGELSMQAITKTLKDAGILDRNGDVIHRFADTKRQSAEA